MKENQNEGLSNILEIFIEMHLKNVHVVATQKLFSA